MMKLQQQAMMVNMNMEDQRQTVDNAIAKMRTMMATSPQVQRRRHGQHTRTSPCTLPRAPCPKRAARLRTNHCTRACPAWWSLHRMVQAST